MLVQAASREIPKLRNDIANTLPGICISNAGLGHLPTLIMSDNFCSNLKVAFRPETVPTKSIVLVTVACATSVGELKKLPSTAAALRLAFYGMPMVSLTTSAARHLGIKLSVLWRSMMCIKTQASISALTLFLHTHGSGAGGNELSFLAPYARIFTTGAFQELSTAENGYYVAVIKTVIAESGPSNEATVVEALEGMKISNHDLREAKALGVAVVDIIREEARKEKDVGPAVIRARENPTENADPPRIPQATATNLITLARAPVASAPLPPPQARLLGDWRV